MWNESRHPLDVGRPAEAIARAYKRGVRIAFGTDAGMPAMAVIRSLTSAATALLDPLCKPGAKTCGTSGVGELAPGKHADLVAVAADPLKDVTELERVTWGMKPA